MTETRVAEVEPRYVVGIGASAGGLEAIERLFDSMPEDTGMAFVIVQHLSPDYKSLMDEVLARWTPMPILKVENGMAVHPNSIYLIPPKKEMVIASGRLLLTDKDPNATLTLPIDHFLRSLAQDCGRRAIAIVLSGTGSDGSRGVADVHNAGGLVIAQSEASAKFDGMPRSVRESGAADCLLAPERIPKKLIAYAADPNAVADVLPLDNASLEKTGLKQVFMLIRDSYGLDFSHYKLNTILRRTERRIALSKIENVGGYVERLRKDPQELGQLYKDLLIGVTKFFRDSEAFDLLVDKAVANLIDKAPEDSEIRVWVAGCATGEEAYTFAILLDEAVRQSGKALQIKIFATDVHSESLETAGHGIYPETSLEEIPQEVVSRCFKRVEEGYQIDQRLRQMIVFAKQNLVKDAPFTKLDLISCRNLLIYLQPQAQRKILSLFHFGLKAGGILMLGPSESPGPIGDEFEAINTKWNIHRKRKDTQILPPDMRWQLISASRDLHTTELPASPRVSMSQSLAMSTYDALLERVLPPSMLVDEEGMLLHTFGDAGKYLRLEHGRHTADIRDRLIDDLRVPVSTAIAKAFKEDCRVTYTSVAVNAPTGGVQPHEVTAEPIHDARHLSRTVLVSIQAVVSTDAGALAELSHEVTPEEFSTEQVSALETELRYTKENLQTTIEELVTSNEELQATNEELVASNEELQSTNEELHSVNQELYTVNAEHRNMVVELSDLTRDMDDLLERTDVDTIFFDSELRIRKFSPRIAKWFNFSSQDIGRRLESFTHSIECDGLVAKAAEVIQTNQPYEEEVRDRDEDWFLLRILPYRDVTLRSGESSARGAVLTLVNISKLKMASGALQEAIRQRDQFLAMLSHELRNPVATILNASHLFDAAVSPAASDEAVAVIRRQSQHVATLLDDLLDVTRVSQGKIQLQHRPFELHPVVEQAIESVSSMMVPRGQTIVVSMPEQPIGLYGSEPRILQVMTNLLSNASKYSGNGDPIKLEVTVDQDSVEIRIVDQGVGISPEQIDRIFELFVQADRTLDRADSGIGVGLTLVRSLIHLHGGEVTAHSQGEGLGSEFCVRLPICEPPDLDATKSGHATAPA